MEPQPQRPDDYAVYCTACRTVYMKDLRATVASRRCPECGHGVWVAVEIVRPPRLRREPSRASLP